jgi:hypothetical protein
MTRAEFLETAKPDLVVNLKLYATEFGGKKVPIGLGWGSPCTVQSEQGAGWVGYDGWLLLLEGPMSPGESRRVGYVFTSGQEVVEYLRSADKFYVWEGRIIGEAKIVDAENSN